jgi:transcription antitermination factor NusA-like protein
MLIYIKLGSITTAQRAAALLREGGINAVIKRIENPQAGDGCGYMVGVNEKNFFKVKNILGRRGIKILGVQNDDIS